jgi:hypothetical protein
MIGMAGENCAGTVKLFEQHDPHQLMRPRRLAESQPDFGALDQARREAVGAADDKAYGRTILRPPLAQQAGKRWAVEAFAPLIEDDDDRSIRDDISQRDRFLDAPPLDVLRPAFADFDNFDVAQAERASGRFGALAIRRGKFPLRSLLEAADGGDEKAHGGTRGGASSSEHMPAAGPTLGQPQQHSPSRAF